MVRLAVCAITVFLVVGCFCRPQEKIDRENGVAATTTVKSPTNRASRLQKPSQGKRDRNVFETRGFFLFRVYHDLNIKQLLFCEFFIVLNLGFDEIVVESNLQVHNRVGSKNKSKIMLPPSNSSSATTSAQTNKSARSLQVQV